MIKNNVNNNINLYIGEEYWMKKFGFMVLLSLSTVSLGFSEVIKQDEIHQKKKILDSETAKLTNFRDFEVEADYDLLKLSIELEKDFNYLYSER